MTCRGKGNSEVGGGGGGGGDSPLATSTPEPARRTQPGRVRKGKVRSPSLASPHQLHPVADGR